MKRPALFLILFFIMLGIARSQESQPLEKFLNADGTLKTPSGFTGPLDPKGWVMRSDENGQPRFTPSSGSGDPADTAWEAQFTHPGIHGTVNVFAVSGSLLYAGGDFLTANGKIVNYIAVWNGSTWSPLGSGVSGPVYALAAHGTDLYVGGNFKTAGGLTVNNIAKWNGSSWSALGSGTDTTVKAIIVVGNDLYAGGKFAIAGGQGVNRIAKWDGIIWSPLGIGMNAEVNALASINSDLYAAGLFTTAGGVDADYIAKWNGTMWSPLGAGTNYAINSLATIGTNLYIGGSFEYAGGINTRGIARWNGTSWDSLSPWNEYSNTVTSLCASGTDIYATGFLHTGGIGIDIVLKWNGVSWDTLGNKRMTNNLVNPIGYAVAVMGSEVFVGGRFSDLAGTGVEYAAGWNGNSWYSLEGEAENRGLNASVFAIAVSGTDIYVGGSFTRAGSVAANRIAKWDGYNWSALGSGLNYTVRALLVVGTTLYAGGEFTTAGGSPANHVARWDGTSWSALGTGTSNPVNALLMMGTTLYAAVQHPSLVHRWNGSTWTALGSGNTGSSANALAAIGTDLYVGGSFSYPTVGLSARNITKWNGSSWSIVGNTGDVGIFINALAIQGGKLFAAGGSVSFYVPIYRWDGSQWDIVDSTKGTVFELLSTATDFYVAGSFNQVGGVNAVSANYIARWDGTNWYSLGTGTNGWTSALALNGNDLFVGGGFSITGEKPAMNLGKWNLGSAPDWSWANSAGGSDQDAAAGIATDDSGNVYVAGSFSVSMNFGATSISSAGASDLFLAKYDPNGNLIWARGYGSISDEYPSALAIDKDGNLLITGAFYGSTLTLDTVTVSKPGIDSDIFVAKFNRDGRVLWVRAAGGGDWDYPTSITTDRGGNAYAAGLFLSSALQFGATPALINSGGFGYDLFVVKYDPMGTAVRARRDGMNSANEIANKIAVDSAGNTYVAGSFTGSSLTFGSNPPLSNSGLEDIFVVKYDTGGLPIWSRSAGNARQDEGFGISVDRSGNVYVTGRFASPTVIIGGTTLTNTIPGLYSFDAFIAKYSSAGNPLWAKPVGGTGDDNVTLVTTDDLGNPTIAGWFGSPMLTIGKFLLHNPTSTQWNLFLSRYDSLGNSLWVQTANGGTLSEAPSDLTIDKVGNVVLAGYMTSSSATFGPHPISNHGSSTNDAFIAKLGNTAIQIPIEQSASFRLGWNLVSVPVAVSNDSVHALFPSANSNAFAYTETGYEVRSTIDIGGGYWLKFPSANKVLINGVSVAEHSIPVIEGWNIIGSITWPVATSNITSNPPGLITSNFFGYSGSYSTADTIQPGGAYWVKVNQSGILTLSSQTSASSASTIRIIPTGEMPPPAPDDETSEFRISNIPSEFGLDQNHPNPFNPITVIKFQLPAESRVTLTVYDILGRDVARLVSEQLPAGEYSRRWFASDFPSGIYFYRLTAGRFTEVKKMLLLK